MLRFLVLLLLVRPAMPCHAVAVGVAVVVGVGYGSVA